MSFPTRHQHNFSSHNQKGEKRTFYVLLLTIITMVVEIVAGTIYGSMALLADGWHMGTHAAAFGITLFAYRYAKKHADSERFSFGTGKVSVLGGYTSAIALGIVALLMLVESGHRLFNPQAIQFNEAIIVACIGLTVNVVSMFLLGDHHHDHGHDHGHDHSHSEHKGHSHDHSHQHGEHQEHAAHKGHHHDHNLRAAYMHVLADTLTSLLAIVALLFGKFYGWNWLDAAMGMVGAVVIAKWTMNLMKQTSPILLDQNIDDEYRNGITEALAPYAAVTDLHMWKVSGHHYSAAITLESNSDKSVSEYKQMLAKFDKINHLTLEVHSNGHAKYRTA
ncbi:Cation diffusion facilitator family transporter [Vibrio crassostreae]|uniref:CDF family Co(II)/Ni(II) efflux transporter DmeF n=1 Tax=Vibrio crassostreae TaxID=246167 RepID=UPI001053149C|nr:CDF family Co(II)/Ni(II) efflux transporter DmeF [Vibrio crassostreae]TCN91461.1 cation diffusion facilitator family transporter [Vibrio crassostreae]CAK2401781.1 Cation diffusion facilitator family transporter [Vibrio crassostreae]CAK2605222.1 Cation diffusion facilitator family transporter [Vibrio crassostreae]CAK3584151.1 Cation diffusion facilitator family transporter [Vibrio crassostreae]CAK4026992.1 Cation diffusion facilitator family transporter [Vibrio crassostreae]